MRVFGVSLQPPLPAPRPGQDPPLPRLPIPLLWGGTRVLASCITAIPKCAAEVGDHCSGLVLHLPSWVLSGTVRLTDATKPFSALASVFLSHFYECRIMYSCSFWIYIAVSFVSQVVKFFIEKDFFEKTSCFKSLLRASRVQGALP